MLLISGARIDMPDLALQLGYFDQALLIRDFRAAVGKTPAEFAKSRGDAGRVGRQGARALSANSAKRARAPRNPS